MGLYCVDLALDCVELLTRIVQVDAGLLQFGAHVVHFLSAEAHLFEAVLLHLSVFLADSASELLKNPRQSLLVTLLAGGGPVHALQRLVDVVHTRSQLFNFTFLMTFLLSVIELVLLPFSFEGGKLRDCIVDFEQLFLVFSEVVKMLPHFVFESRSGKIVFQYVFAERILLTLDWLYQFADDLSCLQADFTLNDLRHYRVKRPFELRCF